MRNNRRHTKLELLLCWRRVVVAALKNQVGIDKVVVEQERREIQDRSS